MYKPVSTSTFATNLLCHLEQVTSPLVHLFRGEALQGPDLNPVEASGCYWTINKGACSLCNSLLRAVGVGTDPSRQLGRNRTNHKLPPHLHPSRYSHLRCALCRLHALEVTGSAKTEESHEPPRKERQGHSYTER